MIRSSNSNRRQVKESSSPPASEEDIQSLLLLGPPPMMNMTNPLSDPTFNETYQQQKQDDDDDATTFVTNPPPSQQTNHDKETDDMIIIMNMTNPLSDPAFNETYQHATTTTIPFIEENNQENMTAQDSSSGEEESSSHGMMMVLNMTNPLSDPAFNETYQHSTGNDSNPNHNNQIEPKNDTIEGHDDDTMMILHPTPSTATTRSPHPPSRIKNETTPTIAGTNHHPQNSHPTSTTSDPNHSPTNHPPSPPFKPIPTGTNSNTTTTTTCSGTTGIRHISCQAHVYSQHHPYLVLALAIGVFGALFRWIRNHRRSSRLSRGEYRAVAAQYIEHDFDDHIVHGDDEDDFGFEEEEEDDGWSTGKRTVEMTSFGDGVLTLEEVNG